MNADPYKDMPREMLMAENIRLQDELKVIKKKPTKEPFVFLNWHASALFLRVSAVFATGSTLCIQATVNAGKAVPMFIAPAIFMTVLTIAFFVWSLVRLSEYKLTVPVRDTD